MPAPVPVVVVEAGRSGEADSARRTRCPTAAGETESASGGGRAVGGETDECGDRLLLPRTPADRKERHLSWARTQWNTQEAKGSEILPAMRAAALPSPALARISLNQSDGELRLQGSSSRALSRTLATAGGCWLPAAPTVASPLEAVRRDNTVTVAALSAGSSSAKRQVSAVSRLCLPLSASRRERLAAVSDDSEGETNANRTSDGEDARKCSANDAEAFPRIS